MGHFLTRYSRRAHSLVALAFAVAAGCVAPGRGAVAQFTPQRVVRLYRTLSLTSITYLIEITEQQDGIRGVMRVTTADLNRRVIEGNYGCRTRRQAADEGPAWVCDVPFARGAPDWAAVLARLDALGIMAPPASRAVLDGNGRPVFICNDGTPWALDIRAGAAAIHDEQTCGPTAGPRTVFEAGIDSVIDAIAATGRVR